MNVLELVVSTAVSWFLSYRIFVIDISKISAERRGRAWNDASLWSALLLCQQLCLVVHFTRTRRTLAGFALGCFWTAAVTAVAGAAAELAGWLTS